MFRNEKVAEKARHLVSRFDICSRHMILFKDCKNGGHPNLARTLPARRVQQRVTREKYFDFYVERKNMALKLCL